MKINYLTVMAFLTVLLGVTQPANAQWQTQSILIKPGWTAVYLHVDVSYTNLDYLVGGDAANPITEVWLWEPSVSSIQYITTPATPITGGSQWANWARLGTGLTGTLASLAPNSAYLIHSTATTNYTWKIKGKPTLPSYTWTTTGINLVGFPTVTNSPPPFDTFLTPIPALQSVADIYQYLGGNLSPSNPLEVFAPHTVTVTRGQAFWIRSGSYYNNYFGPFTVAMVNGATEFGDSVSRTTFHLQNMTPFPVTVHLTLLPSELPPANQTASAGVPPLVVQGSLMASNVTYNVTNLTTTNVLSWNLAPQGSNGSDIMVTLGVNRSVFPNNPGALYTGILKFTDSYGYTEVDVPVSAQAASYAGLWVGKALVSQVANYLKSYQLNATNGLATNGNGSYIVSGVNTNLGATSASFPMRLILHNDGTNVNLLQRVFYGADVNSNIIVSTSESKLDPTQLANARRLTAIQFPWTPTNQMWKFSGSLLPGATLTTSARVNYDDQAANPFLHTYHPDHDNLDATFQHQQLMGVESYQIDRAITLSITAAGNDFNSLTQFGQAFSGNYSETVTVTGLNAFQRSYNVAGSFAINRLSPIAVLTHP